GTLSDFMEKNLHRYPVVPPWTLDGLLGPIKTIDLQKFFYRNGDKAWEQFREQFPQTRGTVEFSRVGLNESVDQALLYVGLQCHWLMGTGHYFLYQKGADGWEEAAMATAWIS